MTARIAPFTPAQRRQVGRAVLAARSNHVSWKILERIYGRSRLQLRRYMALVRDDDRSQT